MLSYESFIIKNKLNNSKSSIMLYNEYKKKYIKNYSQDVYIIYICNVNFLINTKKSNLICKCASNKYNLCVTCSSNYFLDIPLENIIHIDEKLFIEIMSNPMNKNFILKSKFTKYINMLKFVYLDSINNQNILFIMELKNSDNMKYILPYNLPHFSK